MKRTAKRCLYSLVICVMIAGLVPAQDDGSGSARVSDAPTQLPSDSGPVFAGPAQPDGPYFNMTPVERWFAPRFYVDSRAGTLYGYEESFSSVGGFVPYFFEENAMLFFDGRGMAGYDGRGGANAGVGWRYYMPEIDRFIGVNGWYDFDASHARSYNQFGVGFESIGRYFDMILNGYIPVGNRSNNLSTALLGEGTFSGNMLLLDRFNEVESAFTGFDAQVGGPMPIFGRYGLQGYAGFYFFNSSASKTDFTGVSGRLAWQLNEDLNLAVNFSDDHVFGTNTQMQISMTIPDGKPSRWLRPLSVRDRMMQSVQRNYRVTAEREIKISQEAALNPKDNEPYFIVHVDPNVAGDGVAAGDGTIENPYNLLSQFDNMVLADKSGVDIIYVRPRLDDTSTNLNEGVTLLSCQRLLSTSVPHSFEVAQNPGVQYMLSGYVPGQDLPVLTNNSGGDVVTFADGAYMVEVSGFEINGSATGRSITGTNNSAININRNVIQNGLDGIALFNLSGQQVDDMGSFIHSNIIRNNVNDGINVSNSGVGPLDLVIANNPPTTIDFDGVLDTDTDADGVNDTSAPDSLDGDNDFSNDGILANGDDGVDINADAGSIVNLLLDTNIISSNGDNGVELDATANSVIRGSITNNVMNSNGTDGVAITASSSDIDFFNAGTISNNIISGNGDDGISFTGTGNSDMSAALFNNTIGTTQGIAANGGYGLNVSANSGNSLFVVGGPDDGDGNFFLGNELGGMNFDFSGNSLAALAIEGNLVTGAASAGTSLIFFIDGDTFTQPYSITNGSVDGVNLTGFTFNVLPSGHLFDTIEPQGSTPFQPVVDPANPGGQQSDLVTGLVDVNGVAITPGTNPLQDANGVVLPDGGVPDDSSEFTLSFNDFNAGETFSWLIDADPLGMTNTVLGSDLIGSTVSATFSNGTTLTGSLVAVPNNADASVFVASAAAGGGGGDGIHIRASDTATVNPSLIQGNTIAGYGNYGINVETLNLASIPNLVINNNNLQSNGGGLTGGGLQLSRDGNSSLNALVTNNNISSNNGNGIDLRAFGTAVGSLNVDMSDNIVNNNTQDGLNLLAGENAVVTVDSVRDQFTNSGNDNIQVQATDDADVALRFQNVIADGAGAAGFNGTVQGTANVLIDITSPVDPDFTGTQSSFSNNGTNGFQFNSLETGFALITFDDTLFDNNTIDGLNFEREGASLILAQLTNSTIKNNDDDGIQFYTAGAARNDPNTPFYNAGTMLAPATRLVIVDSVVDNNGVVGAENGGNGLETATFGDSVFVVNATRTSFSNSATDGVRSFVGVASSFGEAADRVTFDGVTATGNGRDGIKVFAQGSLTSSPEAFVEVNSNSGNTLLSDNGDDGFQASVPFGRIDVLIQGDTVGLPNFNTVISENANNGVEFNVADAALDGDDTGDLSAAELSKDDLTDLQWASNDGDADGAANEIANFFFPTGYNITPIDSSTATQSSISGTGVLTVQNVTVGDTNLNDAVDRGNGGDGIHIFSSENVNYADRFAGGAGSSGNIQTVTGGSDTTVLVDTSVIAGNTGDGVKIIGDGFDNRDGLQPAEFLPPNIIRATITNNTIRANDNDGIDIDLNGMHGYTQRFGVLQRIGANSFIIDNNLIERNGANGLRYQSNAGFVNRLGFQGNIDSHIRVGFQDPQPTTPPFPYNPANVAAAASPFFQSGFNADVALDNYLNLATVSNSQLVFTNNRVQFNGALIPTDGDGVSIRVGTNTYLSADIGGAAGSGNGNTFSGNSLADVRFESFIAFDPNTGVFSQPAQSIPAGAPTADQIFLDDTAQMDLRFNNNTGSEVSAPFNFFPGEAAIYSVSDIQGGKGVGPRAVQVFQVDDGFNLNATNNWGAQSLPAVFSGGNMHLRTIADPAFPNLAFPVNFDTNPGNPFLP